MTYVSRGTDRVDEEDVRRAVEEVFTDIGGEIMPTIAERWIEQGFQQGVQQGILQSDREAVIVISLSYVLKVVPEATVNRLNEIYDPSILKIFRRKAIKADSLEEFEQIIDLMMK